MCKATVYYHEIEDKSRKKLQNPECGNIGEIKA